MKTRADEWDGLFMRFAIDVANMSRAVRLKVGAVAVRDRRVVAIGYNGTPPGEDNCCEELVVSNETGCEADYEVGAHREWKDCKNWVLRTKSNVIHAEDNLIRFAEEHSIDLSDCTLFITHSPCPMCVDKIIDSGFIEVVYEKHYRIVSDLGRLLENGIKVRRWTS